MTPDTPTPTRGVAFTLDGTEYRLRFTMARLRQIREALGDQALSGALGLEQVTQVIWYGLGGTEGPLTLAALEDLVDLQNLGDVAEAMRTAMGVKDDLAADPTTPRPAANPPGPDA